MKFIVIAINIVYFNCYKIIKMSILQARLNCNQICFKDTNNVHILKSSQTL